MKISIATKNQLAIINQLAHEIWFIAYENIISDEQIKYMLNRMYSIESLEQQLDNNQEFLLIQENDIFIGYASYEINSDLNYKTKIHKLYVLPQYQGKGVGNLLIDEISKTAKLKNQTALFLNVNKNNKAVHFYQKVGFAILFSTVIDIDNSYVMDDFVMEKTI